MATDPIPKHIKTLIQDNLPPEDARGVLREMRAMLRAEAQVPRTSYMLAAEAVRREGKPAEPPPAGEKTKGGADQGYSPYSMGPIGPYNPLDVSLETMGRMMSDGLVRYILDLRWMYIVAVFRNEPGQGWDIECSDEEIKSFLRVALAKLIHRLSYECVYALAYGFQCFEKVFVTTTYRALGITDYRDRIVWVYQKLKANAPDTIESILRDPVTDQFIGYVQNAGSGQIAVEADKALVITHRGFFGNLWGQGVLRSMYPYWWWMQFVWRALLRYLDRCGTPVCIVYAPSDRSYKTHDGHKVNALDLALQTALDIGKSSAAAIPSDVGDNGQALWRVEYLQDVERAPQFLTVLDKLETALMRSGGVPEKITGHAPDQTGAYAAWRIPQDTMMLEVETDLTEFCRQLSDYVLLPLVRYNFGASWQKGSVRVVAEGLDASEKVRARALIQTAMQTSHPDALRLDIAAEAQKVGIPLKEETETPLPAKPSSPIGEGTPPSPRPSQQPRLTSPPLTIQQASRVMAERELAEHGVLHLSGETMTEVAQKVEILLRGGMSPDTPVVVTITGKRHETSSNDAG